MFFTIVCLSVCLSVGLLKSYERILIKFLEGRGVAQGTIVQILVAIWISIRIQEFCKRFLDEIFGEGRGHGPRNSRAFGGNLD